MAGHPALRDIDITARAAPPTGELRVACDPIDPVIVVTGSGLWTVEQMATHLNEYRGALLRKRGRNGVRVLVALADSGAQLPAVTDLLTASLKSCHQPDDDRVAMVVPGALARMQMRRLLDTGNHEFFGSIDEAQAWLAERDARAV